ncbi:hypothetical protein F2Q70_00025575 [Brassica cretica]|uniref:Uncharacterized protein n=1 Tax=Brassica cretica TaxID=69181 RepID=A0A8S9L8F0_BRACR|nr:hypothetical protein F2Q70_00025575 [Brassica cretica]
MSSCSEGKTPAFTDPVYRPDVDDFRHRRKPVFELLTDFLAPQRQNSMGVALNSTLQDLFSEVEWSKYSTGAIYNLVKPHGSLVPWRNVVRNRGESSGSPLVEEALSLLVWQLTLYSIWFERNARIHKQIFRSHSQIAVGMDRTIKNRIHSFRDNNPATTSLMMQF